MYQVFVRVKCDVRDSTSSPVRSVPGALAVAVRVATLITLLVFHFLVDYDCKIALERHSMTTCTLERDT